MKKQTISLNIARFILALLALISIPALLVGATRLIDLPTPVDVIFLVAALSWFSPRLRGIYRRGILVFVRAGLIASTETRQVGFGVLAFANDVYTVSQRVRRFIDRLERE